MDFWNILMDALMLLTAAFVLGVAAQRMKQSAILGYLLAGTLLNPFLFNTQNVFDVAELGVALLLFSIGLEFSLQRLRSIGKTAFMGGTFQIIFTMILTATVLMVFFASSVAVAIGGMIALSSTAVVLRVLVDRMEIDSVPGRNALGILLMQDIAVVPLVLVVTLLGSEKGDVSVPLILVKTLLAAGGLVALFIVVFYFIVPKIFSMEGLHLNRELNVLLALVSALGSIYFAHAVGLSPALGAFIAGLLIGESPFAHQIRADVGTVRTLFVTLFFTSVGLLADPIWFFTHIYLVLPLTILIVIGKTLITAFVIRLLGTNLRYALASGIILSQIGEFSFVLAATARDNGLLSNEMMLYMVSATILSLVLAPYMIAYALPISDFILRRLKPTELLTDIVTDEAADRQSTAPLIIGFGPAGQRVADALLCANIRPKVIELNPRSLKMAEKKGIHSHLGDASSDEILAHAEVFNSKLVVVTVPDPGSARTIIQRVRRMAPAVHVITRSRYHYAEKELKKAGANVSVDEEILVGEKMAEHVLDYCQLSSEARMACAMIANEPVADAQDISSATGGGTQSRN